MRKRLSNAPLQSVLWLGKKAKDGEDKMQPEHLSQMAGYIGKDYKFDTHHRAFPESKDSNLMGRTGQKMEEIRQGR